MIELNAPEKVSSLNSLANRAHEETKRYRDHVWKILVWTIGLFIGVLQTIHWTPELMETCLGVCMGTIFIILVGGCGIWDIHYGYKQFVWNRNVLRDCERRLRFHDDGVYYNGRILPEKWKKNDYKFSECLPHYFQWVLAIIIIALYCIVALWENLV